MKMIGFLIAMALLAPAAAPAGGAGAQKTGNGGPARRAAVRPDISLHPITFHNPYTSGTVRAELLLPARPRPTAAVVLLSGGVARELTAVHALGRYMGRRGFAVLILEPVPASGGTEEDGLNTIAALHFLETSQNLGGAPVGLAGYGDGVRLAVVAAARGDAAAFLALLGGALKPDSINRVPESLTRSAMPTDEALRALAHVRCPVLALIGEFDRHGTHKSASENVDAVRSQLDKARHQNYTIKVILDSDYLLADAGPGGTAQSFDAVPPDSVWATAADWMAGRARDADANGNGVAENGGERHKPIRIYPKSVYGPFPWRPSYVWQPAVGDQPRPYGFWYW